MGVKFIYKICLANLNTTFLSILLAVLWFSMINTILSSHNSNISCYINLFFLFQISTIEKVATIDDWTEQWFGYFVVTIKVKTFSVKNFIELAKGPDKLFKRSSQKCNFLWQWSLQLAIYVVINNCKVFLTQIQL